jgi:competence protein ComEC
MRFAPLRAAARKRRPHLAIACVVAGLALAPAGGAAIGVAVVVAAATAAWAFDARGAAVAALLIVGAAAVGTFRIGSIDRPAGAAPPGSALDATATLLERPRQGLFGWSAPMRIESGRATGLRIFARTRTEWPAQDPGTRFRVRGVVRVPAPSESTAAGEPASRGDPAERDASGRDVSASGRDASGRDGSASERDASAPERDASAPERGPSEREEPSEANAGRPGTPGFGPLPARPDSGDAFDFQAFLRSRGIGREVRVESLALIGRRGGFAGVVDSMRRRAEDGISAALPPDLAALARGMVLGEDGDVEEATRDDFRRSGLAHLLAASGQNVALLCALVLPLLILAGTSQRLRIAVLLPLVGIYVALAGSGASIMRAGVMAAAGLVALAAGRRSSAVYALLLAAVVTLALNPRATGDPGWRLSFVAVAGMLALGPVVARPLRRLPRWAAEAVGATVAATVATAPLLAHEFGAVSVAALPANLLAIPAVAPIMWIGMAEAAVEQLAAVGAPFDAIAHAAASLVAPFAALALRWVAGVAGRFADPAWAQAKVELSWPALATAYLATAATAVAFAHPRWILAAARRIMRADPGGGSGTADPGGGSGTADPPRSRAGTDPSGASAGADPARKRAAGSGGSGLDEVLDWLRALSPASRRAFAAPVVAVGLAAAAHAAAPPAAPRHLTVDFIDVGQGDATLIRDPTGAAVLFDGGVPEARVDRTLRRLGVRKLSVVVATHQSRDHHGGLLQVVKRFPVGLFLDGRDGVPDRSFELLEQEVDRRRIARRATHAGETLHVGGMTIRILWPPRRAAGEPPPDDPNDRATVAVVSAAGFDLFLSADAESHALLPLDLPQVDAMKVPHHGSADPDLPRLLERLRPKIAAIETGRGNPYGHPTPPTLDALRTRVPHVFRSDRDGTTELTVSGDRIAIRTHR